MQTSPSTLATITAQFDAIQKIKCFEIPVINTRTEESEYLLFNISIEGGKFLALHEPLTFAEKESGKLSFCTCDIDTDFSIDENLETLYDVCISAITESDFFELD